MDTNTTADSAISPSLEAKVEETLKLSRENNKMLRAMRRAAWFWLAAKTVIWLVVLGLPVLFLGPYIQGVMDRFSSTGTSTSLFGFPTPHELNEAIDQYRTR